MLQRLRLNTIGITIAFVRCSVATSSTCFQRTLGDIIRVSLHLVSPRGWTPTWARHNQCIFTKEMIIWVKEVPATKVAIPLDKKN